MAIPGLNEHYIYGVGSIDSTHSMLHCSLEYCKIRKAKRFIALIQGSLAVGSDSLRPFQVGNNA